MKPHGLSWFEREIAEQPEAIQRTLDVHRSPLGRWWRKKRILPPYMLFVGRGSSWHASLYAQILVQCEFRIPAMIAQPAVEMWYRRSLPKKKAWVFGLSQSGETPDVVDYLRQARRDGAYTVAITNQARSPLAGAAHEAWVTPAGPERAVPSSKTYTSQLALLALWAALGSRNKGLESQLARIPEWTAETIEQSGPSLQRGLSIPLDRGCLVLGRGFQHLTALETAMKLREVGRVLAAGMSTPDFLHTAQVLTTQRLPLVVCGAQGALNRHLREVEAACRKNRNPLLWLGNDRKHAGVHLSYPSRVPEWLSPMPSAVLGQLLAAAWGRKQGWNLDGAKGYPKITRVR